MTLDALETDKEAVIVSVGGEGALRLRLLDMGLTPRTKVKIVKTAPLGDPIELMVRGYALSLRKEDAKNITVETQPPLTGYSCADCKNAGICGSSK